MHITFNILIVILNSLINLFINDYSTIKSIQLQIIQSNLLTPINLK